MKNLKIKTLTGYCDRDVVLLHASFQILVDFVDLEWGGKNVCFGKLHKIKEAEKDMKSHGYSKRDIKREITHLVKSNEITNEIWDLYNWWVKVRPVRVDSHVYDPKKRNFTDEIEDDEMLIRLVKVRANLWT